MGTNRTTWMAAVLGTVAVAGMMGCHKDAKDFAGMGSAAIQANVKLAISDVASLSVVVQGGTMPAAITIPLVKKGNQFSAIVSDLPVGTNYSFTASAKDASNVELYHGAVTNATIVKNQTANIVINMNQDAAGVGTNNNAPVIDVIIASSLSVSQNDQVMLGVQAHDPDAGQTALMGWSWTSTCGTLQGAPTGTVYPGTDTVHGVSQINWVAPAADGPCAISVTVTDANGVLKNTASLTIQVNSATGVGSAKITALPNTYPVISGLNGTPVPLVKAVPTTLTVTATDADGDALNYHWTSPCAGVFSAATSASTTFTLDSASAATSCDFVVVVDDGLFPDGSVKGVITNHLTLPVYSPANNDATSAPVFGYNYQSQDTISGGDVVKMAIVANQGCAAPGVITLAWASSDSQVLGSITPASIPLDATLFHASAASYTAAAGAEDGSVVTITVTALCSTTSQVATHTFTLVPLNSFCFGKAAGTDCTATASGSNKCVTAAACNATGVCVASATLTCSQAGVDQCKTNACVPSTGLCALSNKVDSTPCNDNNACTGVGGTDQCGAGVCTGTAKVCPGATNQCQTATCDTVSGACGATNKADGTTCSDGLACTTADVCAAGTCGGTATSCPGGFVCEEPAGSCVAKVCMNPSNAKKIVPPLLGLGVSASGTPWVAGNIYNPFDFGSGSVSSSGSADLYLAKMDPATNLSTETFTFGDTGGKDQTATGVAVASSGNVGLIGIFAGEIDFTANNSDGSGASGNPGTAGTDFLQNASAIPFYGVFDGTSTGAYVTPKLVHMVDVGTGALLGIGSNPTQNAIAICGKTSKVVPNYSASGATKGVITGGTAVAGGGMDIVVAKIDGTTGAVIWGKQFGGAGDQICESVAIDNNGDVIIAGGYTGTLAFSGFPVVADTSAALLYVAKLNGTTGAVTSAATWGTAGRTSAYGLTVDASSNIVVAGSLGANIDFGGGISITNLGLTDAFVAKLTTALVPVWAKSYGDAAFDQTAKAVGVASNGDVFVGGSFKGTLGALGLTSASTTALDAWTAQLASADGATLCAHAYGDAAGAQAVGNLTVARTATGALANSMMMSGGFSGAIVLGSATLDTGSASLTASYLTRLIP